MSRVWRFDENGKAKDAGTFDDSFVLASEVPIYVNPAKYHQLEEWWEKAQLKYDYLCIRQGKIFPVNDHYTRSKDALDRGQKRAEEEGLVFSL